MTLPDNNNSKDSIGSLEEPTGLANPGMQAHQASFDRDCVGLCKSAARAISEKLPEGYLPVTLNHENWYEP